MNASTKQQLAQRLVTLGYGGYRDDTGKKVNFLRRNYFVQLVDDTEHALAAKTKVDIEQLLESRRCAWIERGILSIRVFEALVAEWLHNGNITSGTYEANAKTLREASSQCAYFVDIGITFDGFERLGSHTQLTDLFRRKAPAFCEGAFLRADKMLGDSGQSAPTRWAERYRPDRTHAIFVVHAPNGSAGERGFHWFEKSVIEKMLADINPVQLGKFGITPDWETNDLAGSAWVECSSLLGEPKVQHFDLIDGISSPKFVEIQPESLTKLEASFNVHNPGELLLGHRRNDKSNPWLVLGAFAQAQAAKITDRPHAQVAYSNFFRDGCFGVFRMMRQDVKAFEAFLDQQAKLIAGNRNIEYTKGWIKAKIVGRWANGDPVGEEFEQAIGPALTEEQKSRLRASENSYRDGKTEQNTFSFKDDPDGLKCPFGAHIRRTNPRDDPVVPKQRRPILRRGVPFGKRYVANEPGSAEAPRGLLGLFFCASIEEQFEPILGNWVNNNPMGLPVQRHGKDPLIGNQDLIENSFQIPMKSEDRRMIELKGLRAFVHTQGTSYAFFPNIQALHLIAQSAIQDSAKFLSSALIAPEGPSVSEHRRVSRS